ncbi:hypothetical protein [uncultured Bosea sp.]|uniref:hypothetical protein n=1 Tax=uncultured Bosea sp. TaxID=211457 RepID=UPI00263A4DE1|nr:hypothetical protein [uncultured Bosea sp.]
MSRTPRPMSSWRRSRKPGEIALLASARHYDLPRADDRIAAGAVGDGKVGHAELAGIDGAGKTDEGGPVTIKSGPVVLDGADLSSLLTANPGGLRFSRFSWTNVAITAPDKDTPATAAGGNLYTINLGALTAGATFDGSIPLKGAMSIKGLSVQPPTAAVAGQQLKAE